MLMRFLPAVLLVFIASISFAQTES
ncbi:MAG: hypothetical protein RL131_72, partial [Bacteroidota bacterium]